MARRSVKLLAAGTFAGALAVTGYFLAEVVREEVAIRRLGSAVESERFAAAEFLATRRCVRAIPALLEAALPSWENARYDPLNPEPRPLYDALDAIVSARAVPQVLQALRSEKWGARLWAAVMLERLDAQSDEVLCALREVFLESDEELCRQVAAALRRFGQRAVPVLRRALVRVDGAGFDSALETLETLSPNAKGAVPLLTTLLDDSDRRIADAAMLCLVEIDADAFVIAAEAIMTADDIKLGTITWLMDNLERMWQGRTQEHRLLVSRLEALLGHEKYNVRRAAAACLWRLQERKGARLLAVLDEMAEDREALWREGASMARQSLEETSGQVTDSAGEDAGEPAQESVSLAAVLAAARSADHHVHEEAYARLEEMPVDRTLLPELTNLLEDADPEIRAWAAHSLGKLGSAAGGAVPALQHAMEGFSLSVRFQAACALLTLGRESTAAEAVVVEHLRSLFESGEFYARYPKVLRRTAHLAARNESLLSDLLGQGDRNLAGDILGDLDLSDVRPLRAGVVAIVASALSSADAEIRLKAAVALETAGPSARSAQPALVEAWRTGNAELRCLAIRALGAILAGPDALPVFLEALEDPIEQISIDAADGLGSLGALAAPAIPALIGRLRRNKLAHAASYALVKIGPPAAAPLAAALEGAPDDLRSWIAYTLGGMHGASEVAVPALERLLGDENDITRMNAAEALGRLGSPARPAVRALEAARHDAHAGVRRHAESALFKIGCSAEASDPAPGHLRILRRVITWDRHVLQQGPPALHGQLFCTRCRPR